MSKGSFTGQLSRWEALLAGAKANLEDLPALEHYRARLEAALADVRAAQDQQLSRAAEARQATQEVQNLLKLGRELAAQLESGVRLLYGRRSPKLGELGMKPLPFTRARRKVSVGCVVKGCPLVAPATGK